MADDTGMMTDLHNLLRSVAAQLMNGPEVVIADGSDPEQKLRVTRVGGGRLRTVRARINGREVQAIEQIGRNLAIGVNSRVRDIR